MSKPPQAGDNLIKRRDAFGHLIADAFAPYFSSKNTDYKWSQDFRIGFGSRANRRSKAPVEVHPRELSVDGHVEITLDLSLGNKADVIAAVGYALIFLVVNEKNSFNWVSGKIGYVPSRSKIEPESPELVGFIAKLVDDLPDFPGASLNAPPRVPKKPDGTRNLLVSCVGRLKGGIACTHHQRASAKTANTSCCGVHGRDTIRVKLESGEEVTLSYFPPLPEADDAQTVQTITPRDQRPLSEAAD